MTIKDFCKIINEHSRVRVFDSWGYVGVYDVPELPVIFNEYRNIIEIKAYKYGLIGIRIDRY